MTTPDMQALPNFTCPLCGGPNGCAAATSGDLSTPCWCTGITIDPALLAGIPESARNEACICARCAQADAGAGQAIGNRLPTL